MNEWTEQLSLNSQLHRTITINTLYPKGILELNGSIFHFHIVWKYASSPWQNQKQQILWETEFQLLTVHSGRNCTFTVLLLKSRGVGRGGLRGRQPPPHQKKRKRERGEEEREKEIGYPATFPICLCQCMVRLGSSWEFAGLNFLF